MPDNRNRKRPIQVKFFVDEKEQALIKKKMEHAGIENMSAYIRNGNRRIRCEIGYA